MNNKTRVNIESLTMLFLLAICSFSLGAAFSYNDASKGSIPIARHETPLDNVTYGMIKNYCQAESGVINRTNCVRNHLSPYFIYKVRDDAEEVTFQEILTEGGDCGNWARLYIDYAKDFDLNYEFIRIPSTKGFNHVFTILYDGTGYCLADQMNLFCYEYDVTQFQVEV